MYTLRIWLSVLCSLEFLYYVNDICCAIHLCIQSAKLISSVQYKEVVVLFNDALNTFYLRL